MEGKQNPYKHTTILDIAKELNVSKSTVSRALNNHSSIGETTKKAIQDLAKKYNYYPNSIASSLTNRSTKTIGVIVPLLSHYYFSTVISGIEELAYKSGYKVIVGQSAESYQREVILSQTMLSSKIDGLLVSISSQTNNSDHLKAFQERNIPVIFFDRICPDIEASFVIIDDYMGSFKAVEHLILQGCRKIAHFAGPAFLNISQNRINGYKAALQKYNIPFEEELLIFCAGLESENAVKATQVMLDSGIMPDGVFAFCDPLAIGVMMALKANNIKIPDQVAVVGFCNEPMATVVEPGLSTLVQPAFKIGETAAQLFFDHINNPCRRIQKQIFSTELIVRESSKKK
jgi:DNA-binding LacI/PurR family transcriptional regulator